MEVANLVVKMKDGTDLNVFAELDSLVSKENAERAL